MKRTSLPLVLIIIGGLIILGVTTLLVYQTSGKGVIPTPARLAGFTHTRLITRSEAVKEIQQLHGKEFDIGAASLVDYGGGKVRLWVAELSNSTQAAAMIASMQKSIALGGSPFTPIAQQDIGDRTVYALEGLDQVHFYFQSGSHVVWIGADPDLAEAALDETLAFFP